MSGTPEPGRRHLALDSIAPLMVASGRSAFPAGVPFIAGKPVDGSRHESKISASSPPRADRSPRPKTTSEMFGHQRSKTRLGEQAAGGDLVGLATPSPPKSGHLSSGNILFPLEIVCARSCGLVFFGGLSSPNPTVKSCL